MPLTRVTTSLRIVGHVALQRALASYIVAGHREKARGKWYVVSVVRYAEFLEFGTMTMPARPHWRVATLRVADRIRWNKREQQDILNAMIVGGNLRKEMAQRLVSRLRKLIRAGDMIDTGNYIASIAMGPTEGEALENSLVALLDPTTSILIDFEAVEA